jgi:methylated-DNA-[protein]-cysteine S-methyltransferase
MGVAVSTADHDIERRLREPIALPGDTWEQLQARLVERAQRDGLLDVAYARVDSPLGRLLVAATAAGIVRLAYENEAADAVLDELAVRVSPRLLEAPARLDGARRQLEQYFNGERTRFDLPLDWALSSGFRRRVLEATAGIHYGATATYRTVATNAGSPRAVRAAGSALATNPIPLLVPCHRVVRSDGGLGGYRGGLGRKAELLRLETGE